MASLALVRALSLEASDNRLINHPKRVPSSTLIDKMKTIHEDQLLIPSPSPKKKNYNSFNYVQRRCVPPGSLSFTKGLLASSPIEEESSDCCGSTPTFRNVLIAFLAVMTVFSLSTQVITLPLFTDAMTGPEAESGPFIASFIATMWGPIIFFSLIFFFSYIQNPRDFSVFRPCAPWPNIVAAGVLGGLASVLVAFTSLPNRTHPGLQAILQQISIPCTVFTRFLILRKGINRRQFVCMVTLFIGIFITLEPSIFNIRVLGPALFIGEANPYAWYYYLIYGFSQLPLAFSYSLMEQGQKSIGAQTLSYTAWYQLFVFLSYFLFFWIDFIPGFGTTSTGSFFPRLQNGFLCYYGADKSCLNVPPLAAVYTISTAGSILFSILLIRFAEGALFTVIVMAFVTPLSALFWNLFSAELSLHWDPKFDLSAMFLIGGLAIMMPSVVMYAYFRDDIGEAADPLDTVKGRAQTVGGTDIEKHLAIKEQARQTRRKRRSRSVTQNASDAGLAVFRNNLQNEGLQGFVIRKPRREKKEVRRVRSMPSMMGGF